MSEFKRVASEVREVLATHIKVADAGDENWQRVHSAIADLLKDLAVSFYKVSRLQGDFAGEEHDRLMQIGDALRTVSEELGNFSKAFIEGKYEMVQSEFTYGNPGGGGGGDRSPAPSPTPTPPSPPPSESVPFGASPESPSDYSGEGESEGKSEKLEEKVDALKEEDYSGEEEEAEEKEE